MIDDELAKECEYFNAVKPSTILILIKVILAQRAALAFYADDKLGDRAREALNVSNKLLQGIGP